MRNFCQMHRRWHLPRWYEVSHTARPFGQRGTDSTTLFRPARRDTARSIPMDIIGWIITLVVVAIIAGALGFGGVASAAGGGASILFWVLIILVLGGLVFGALRRR